MQWGGPQVAPVGARPPEGGGGVCQGEKGTAEEAFWSESARVMKDTRGLDATSHERKRDTHATDPQESTHTYKAMAR